MKTQLSIEERNCLDEYAREHGRNWKSKLREEWMQMSGLGLHLRLRNVSYFGPRGLIAYRANPIPRGWSHA